jgi:signal peptidase I
MLSMLIVPIALLLTIVGAEKYAIQADSMAPNFIQGDIALGWRYPYGFSRYSFRSFSLPIEGRLFGSQPNRGDVVALCAPPSCNALYIKRIVGLPGDTIQMVRGVLHINGKPVQLTVIGPYAPDLGGKPTATVQRETLPDGPSYEVLNIEDGSVGDDSRKFEVPVGKYFVLGDNRDNSSDSRFRLGFVPYQFLISRIDRIR